MTSIEYIKKYILDNFKKFPPQEGEPPIEPCIYYMNGNDGTDFDWKANNRTCEFYLFYQSNEALGYMKVYATRDGMLEGYVFDTERYYNGVELPSCSIGYQAAVKIKRWCMENFDKKDLYDQAILDLPEVKTNE